MMKGEPVKRRRAFRLVLVSLLGGPIIFSAWSVEAARPGNVRAVDDWGGVVPRDEGAPDREASVSSGFFLAQQARPQVRRPANRPPTVPTPPRRSGMEEGGELGNQYRPKTGEKETEPFWIDFEDTDLKTVIETIGLKTGRNFEMDPSVGQQKVTIISHHKVPPELAYEILESILASRELKMVETLDGNLVKIRPRAQKNAEKLSISVGTGDPPEGFEELSIHIVNVQYADAQEVASLLQVVGSSINSISVYGQTNTLVITDTAEGIRNMWTLLKEIDVPGYETEMEIFTLEYTRAEVLVNQIQEVLDSTGRGGRGRPGQPQRPVTPTRAQRVTRPSNVPGQRAPQVVGQREEVLRMVPDERLNALIVVASEPLMNQVRDLIDQLDTPTPYEANNMHYVELLNAEAEAVEEALKAITGTTPRQGGQQGGGATGEVQPFEKKVTITRYEQTNALLIVASPQDFKLLREMIDRLDVPRRQVSVEAIIMEVTISDRFELSVESAGLSGSDAFALNNVIDIARAIASGPLTLAGLGTTIGILDGTTEITVPTGFDDTGTPTGTTLQTIPNVPLLLRALETLTDVEVLSQPNLLTVDNEEASIIVGQEVPVLTSLADTSSGAGGGYYSRSSIQREEVGVKMKVTPQVNEGDYVSLEVNVEVSEVVDSSADLGPTFQKGEITSKVVIKDGSTGIIGGLLTENRNRTVFQAPILGDLPLFGWLFRKKVSARRKRNLVVLLTPHIIKEGHDLERVTDFRMENFYNRNVDVLFQKGGFIKKLKRKHYQRTRYHPTDRFNPNAPVIRDSKPRRSKGRAKESTGETESSGRVRKSFGKGDIER